jgi:pimeloyl-ACP methyl ester carboxylesterase
MIRGFKLVIIVYGLGGILLWHFQEYLLLHPKAVSTSLSYNFQIPHKELLLPVTEKDSLSIVQFQTSIPRKGLILFFHGNRENITRYVRYAKALTQKGYDVWMTDYPGFGKTTGAFTEARVYQDARLLYQLAGKHFSCDSIIIYGKSLGTGIAAELASRFCCKRLILETPYCSIPQLAGHYFPFYPTKRMSRYQFPVYEYLSGVKAPVTIFHGTRDEVIPYSHALRLKKQLKNQDIFITVQEAKHSNLLEFVYFNQMLKSYL